MMLGAHAEAVDSPSRAAHHDRGRSSHGGPGPGRMGSAMLLARVAPRRGAGLRRVVRGPDPLHGKAQRQAGASARVCEPHIPRITDPHQNRWRDGAGSAPKSRTGGGGFSEGGRHCLKITHHSLWYKIGDRTKGSEGNGQGTPPLHADDRADTRSTPESPKTAWMAPGRPRSVRRMLRRCQRNGWGASCALRRDNGHQPGLVLRPQSTGPRLPRPPMLAKIRRLARFAGSIVDISTASTASPGETRRTGSGTWPSAGAWEIVKACTAVHDRLSDSLRDKRQLALACSDLQRLAGLSGGRNSSRHGDLVLLVESLSHAVS